MKKLIYPLFALALLAGTVHANIVASGTAQKVAENYYKQNAQTQIVNSVLVYTAATSAGDPLYYVYNINGNEGFVIVSAEDAGSPIIGFSTEGSYVAPTATSNPNLNFWMEKRKEDILEMRTKNLQPTARIQSEWVDYASNKFNPMHYMGTPHAALCKTTWNQNGGGTTPYNAYCPSGCPVGCVATAMVQIMKFWAFPTKGTGSSSYTAGSYGTLSANYGTTTYNWANMGLSSSNTDVARVSSHAGISVEMNYAPAGSGAQVCGGKPSAQYSYVNYFGYDPLIKCVSQAADPNWIATLENEFAGGRPMQYQGVDASAGGHTWVCDGNTAADLMHMNWGWGGASNGNYAVTALNPSGYAFNQSTGGLINIKPLVLATVDAGSPAIITPNGGVCNLTFTPVVKVKNFGVNTLTSCTVNYKVDNGSTLTAAWSGSLVTNASANFTLPGVTSTAGAHTFTSFTTNPNGTTDGKAVNDTAHTPFIIITSATALPLVEGFESNGLNIPVGWSVYNPDGDAAWQVSDSVFHNGTKAAGFNNCDGNGQSTTAGMIDRMTSTIYDFSGAGPSAGMTFDVAHVPAFANNKLYLDTLEVKYSTDCGATWTQIYSKGGTALATAPQFTITGSVNCVKPKATEWRHEVISLSAVAGQASVMFNFENHSDWGNWIWVDDININSLANGVGPVNSAEGFSIYPNPATSVFTMQGNTTAEKVHYSIYNVVGSEVRVGEIAGGGSTFKGMVSVNDLSRGMYFIKVTDGANTWTKKLNVQ